MSKEYRYNAVIGIGAGGSYGNANDVETAIENALHYAVSDFGRLFDLHRKPCTVRLWDRETDKEWSVEREFPFTRIETEQDLDDADDWLSAISAKAFDDDTVGDAEEDACTLIQWLEDAMHENRPVSRRRLAAMLKRAERVADHAEERLSIIYA